MTKFCLMAHEITSCWKSQSFKNIRWRMAAILKIVKCDILATVWPILVKFGTAMHAGPPNLMVTPKFQNFKIQDGGRRPSWKSKNCDISKTIWPITSTMKFWMMTPISPPELTSCSKNQTFKNPRWQMATNLTIVKCDISATNCPILMKFVWQCILVVPTWSATKNLKT